MGQIQMHLFKKEVVQENGNKFDTYFLKFPNTKVAIATKLTNALKEDFIKNGVVLPCDIVLDSEVDYFIVDEVFKNANGEDQIKQVCVIQSYTDVLELSVKKTTLEDYLKSNLE